MKQYEVHPYSIQTLKQLLAERSDHKASLSVINAKLHSVYFEEYFAAGGVSAQTIVVEKEYIDRDFLDDFAGYYVRCFQDYRHVCSRLHFFDFGFSKRSLTNAITGRGSETVKKLQKGYLGFVVVKPLPQTVIGRTCLRTYGDASGQRQFPIVRTYEANLFGIPLRVKTLAFQEQDSVVAACASSALWSAFHGTGMLFHHPIPSPVEITRSATRYLPLENRTFPNPGLNGLQMSHAIRDIGLEPLYFDTRDEATLKSVVFGYLSLGLPIIMGVELWDMSNPASPIHSDEDYHAITVTGYNLPVASIPTPDPDTRTLFTASRIDKLYVHDDQVGPFSRALFDGVKIVTQQDGKTVSMWSLHSSWRGEDRIVGSMRLVPSMMLIPVYHKIRIPITAIKQVVGILDALIRGAVSVPASGVTLPQHFQWSVLLTSNSEWKRTVRGARNLANQERLRLLCDNSPRFVWRATALMGGVEVLDLLFDATDIEQGSYFLKGIVLDRAVGLQLRKMPTQAIIRTFSGTPLEPVLRWLSTYR